MGIASLRALKRSSLKARPIEVATAPVSTYQERQAAYARIVESAERAIKRLSR